MTRFNGNMYQIYWSLWAYINKIRCLLIISRTCPYCSSATQLFWSYFLDETNLASVQIRHLISCYIMFYSFHKRNHIIKVEIKWRRFHKKHQVILIRVFQCICYLNGGTGCSHSHAVKISENGISSESSEKSERTSERTCSEGRNNANVLRLPCVRVMMTWRTCRKKTGSMTSRIFGLDDVIRNEIRWGSTLTKCGQKRPRIQIYRFKNRKNAAKTKRLAQFKYRAGRQKW